MSDHFFDSLLWQIISPVENDVVLEDMFERTTTANSSASVEEEIDEGGDDISGNCQFFIPSLAGLLTSAASFSCLGFPPSRCFCVRSQLDSSFLSVGE